jgi:intracellular sulfur oxidation DsrE/DsrF family protein
MLIDRDLLPRRSFLERLTVGTAAVTAGTLFGACATPASASPRPTVLPTPTRGERPASDWDFSWVDRVTRPHRMVFDTPQLGDGMAVMQVNNWMRGFAEAYGATDADLNPVIVFRHEAIPAALTDAMHARLGRSMSNMMPTVEQLMARGAIVLACNFALMGQAQMLRQKENLSQADALREIRAAVRPGIYVMPNGIFAVGRAQEAGCAYLRAG